MLREYVREIIDQRSKSPYEDKFQNSLFKKKKSSTCKEDRQMVTAFKKKAEERSNQDGSLPDLASKTVSKGIPGATQS